MYAKADHMHRSAHFASAGNLMSAWFNDTRATDTVVFLNAETATIAHTHTHSIFSLFRPYEISQQALFTLPIAGTHTHTCSFIHPFSFLFSPSRSPLLALFTFKLILIEWIRWCVSVATVLQAVMLRYSVIKSRIARRKKNSNWRMKCQKISMI